MYNYITICVICIYVYTICGVYKNMCKPYTSAYICIHLYTSCMHIIMYTSAYMYSLHMYVSYVFGVYMNRCIVCKYMSINMNIYVNIDR